MDSPEVSGFREWRRAAIATVLLLVIASLAWWMGTGIHENLLKERSDTVGLAWSCLALAVTALIRALGELTDYIEMLDGWIKGKSDFKANVIAKFWVLCVCTFLGFHSIRLLLNKPSDAPSTRGPPPSAVLVVTQASPSVAYLTAPAVLFHKGKLADPDGPLVTEDHGSPETLFDKKVFDFDSDRKQQLQDIVAALHQHCAPTASKQRIFVVLGFASDMPFLNSNKRARTDSRALNFHIANVRARRLAKELSDVSMSMWPGSDFRFAPRGWKNPGEMEQERDKIFRNMKITFDSAVDHRSALVIKADGGACPFLQIRGNQDI